MDAGLLETLVKLAGIGTTVVCVLAVGWSAYLLVKTPADATGKERYRTILYFLAAAVAIAALSAVITSFGAYFNHRKIVDLRVQNTMLAKDNELMAGEVGKVKVSVVDLEKERDGLIVRYAALSKSLRSAHEQLDLATKQRDFFRMKLLKAPPKAAPKAAAPNAAPKEQ